MKTILHTIDTAGPGGAETVFIDLATGLPKDKYRSVVVIPGKGWVYEELCRRGIKPVLLDTKGSFNFRYLAGLRKIIRDESVDLIQSHLLGTNVYCSLVGLLTATPVVAIFHGVVDISENERFKGLKFAAINAGANCVVAVTDSLLEDIVSRTSLKKKKTAVIYNGIDTAAFVRSHSNSLRRKYGWHEDDIIIGSLGNIDPPKGYDLLLKAADLLKQSPHSFRFVIAGQGQGKLYDELMNLRKTLDLEDKVHFLGFIDDVADFLANIDLFLSTSTSEGLPLSALQAMVAAKPMIVPRCGGYVSLITHRENGVLTEVGNPAAIAEAVEMLVSDAELQTSMADNAKVYAIETYDIQVMLDAYDRLYEQFVDKGRKG